MKFSDTMRKQATVSVLFALAFGMAGSAFAADDYNLRTLAVTNADGSLKVLYHGSNAWWNATGEYAPFDGDTSTFIDPKRIYAPTWVGYELAEPRVVTRVRFCVPERSDIEDRLRGCRVEGANEPDFSDAVILLDVMNAVPEHWLTGSPYWVEAPAQQMATPQAFKYLRFIQWRRAVNSTGANEGAYYCGNIAELEFYGLDMESYASYVAPAVTNEVNLRLYAMHDAAGALDILSDKTVPYDTGYGYNLAFDGKLSTFYDPKNGVSHYVGYALAKPMAVTRIRYSGRQTGTGAASRLRYCQIEGANQPDFSDAVAIHFCTESVPADYDTTRGWIEVQSMPGAGVTAFKYLRLFEPAGNQQCGDVSELEFYGMDADALAEQVLANPQPPTDLTVGHGDFPNANTILKWKLQPGVSDTTILRAPGLGGPWTEVAQLSGSDRWSDATAPAGSVSYYKLIANYTYNGEGFSSTNETLVSARRWRLLERDPSDMSQLRSGVSVIYKSGGTENGSTKLCWTPTTGYTFAAVTNSLMLAFDNNTSTYPDVRTANWQTSIGVDFGNDPCYVAYMRMYFYLNRTDRLGGVRMAGSNTATWYGDGNFTDLTEPFEWVARYYWYEAPCAGAQGPYRYLFCYNPVFASSSDSWADNASELQFYGWSESDLAGLAMDVSDLAVSYGTTPSATLTWTPVKYGTYTIERKVADGEWSEVANGLAASTTTWTDTGVTAGTRYTYRVKTVNGENEAYSLSCEAVPYATGNGVGLHGVWSRPYSTMDVGEEVVAVTTNAIDFANASVGGETANFFVRWTGKLIVPFAGDYTFDAEADDTVALWIDGAPILYRGAAGGAMTLTAGEHDVVATWFQGDGENFCRFYWGGPVARAVIPSTQLVPVAPPALPEEWEGARTFSNAADICNPGDVRFNANGTIDLAYGGADLYFTENGYSFLWRKLTGDFVCVARVESIRAGTESNGQKGGLMVRAALDSAAPFEACMLKWEGGPSNRKLYLGNKRCSARGKTPTDGKDIITGQGAWKHPVTGNAGWIKIKREGNVFTSSYKSDGETAWTPIYRLVDKDGAYGDTVYAGLASAAVDSSIGRIPHFDWRFSNLVLRKTSGTAVLIR